MKQLIISILWEKGTKDNSSPEDEVTNNALSQGKEGTKDDSTPEDEVTDNSLYLGKEGRNNPIQI